MPGRRCESLTNLAIVERYRPDTVVFAFALLGAVNIAIAHRAGRLMEAATAEELRERGRLLFYSFAWMVASGLLLIVLGLATPGACLRRRPP